MLDDLRADVSRYPGGLRAALENPGFYATALYRVRREVQRWPRWRALPAKAVLKPLSAVAAWALGITISPEARIGPGLYVGHWGGIRVGRTVVMGARCNLSPGVILGFGIHNGLRGEPQLGDRVYVGPGAKIIGPVRVGSDVAVGANAVVCRDVPDHVSVGGVPARIISPNGSAAYIEVGQPLGTVAPRNVVKRTSEEKNVVPQSIEARG
jgi:serine O-acetyltransferase